MAYNQLFLILLLERNVISGFLAPFGHLVHKNCVLTEESVLARKDLPKGRSFFYRFARLNGSGLNGRLTSPQRIDNSFS